VETLLNAARPLLSRDTREALNVFGTDKARWKAEMMKTFDFSKLPPQIGGTQEYKSLKYPDDEFD